MRLNGDESIEDPLRRLNILMQGGWTAAAHVLQVADNVKGGVEIVGESNVLVTK